MHFGDVKLTGEGHRYLHERLFDMAVVSVEGLDPKMLKVSNETSGEIPLMVAWCDQLEIMAPKGQKWTLVANVIPSPYAKERIDEWNVERGIPSVMPPIPAPESSGVVIDCMPFSQTLER